MYAEDPIMASIITMDILKHGKPYWYVNKGGDIIYGFRLGKVHVVEGISGTCVLELNTTRSPINTWHKTIIDNRTMKALCHMYADPMLINV